MTTERIVINPEELDDDVGLSENEILDTIKQEEQETASAEATGDENAQDAPEPDIFQKAAESLTAAPDPEVVTRSDLDGAFSKFAETMRAEIASMRDSGADVGETSDSVDEAAFEAWLNDGVESTDPSEIARAKAEFRAMKSRLEKENTTNDTITDKIASIEQKIDNLANRPQTNTPAWNEADAQHINNSITYLGAAHGLNIDFNNQTQLAAILDGVQPGEDVRSVIQKINTNMDRVKNNTNTNTTNQTYDVAESTAATVPSLGGAITTNDNQVFNSIDEIRLAIADGRIDVEDYNKYVAQLS